MNRWLSILTVVLVLFFVGGWLTWYFAYGISHKPPRQAAVEGLSGTVEAGWHEAGFATIEAQSEADAYAGLGYAQGVKRAWTLLLLRQAALGRQAEWFGDSLLAVDRLSRRLAFGSLAEQAYDTLSSEDQALLGAFSHGVNAALQSRAVLLSEEVARLNVEPEPWQPWHTLAVERLYAWLITSPPPSDSLSQMGSDAQAFFKADALLRNWLHLHGFQNSTAWAVRDSTGTHFYQRQVYGDTALPFYFEAVLQWPGASVTSASIPGTPFFQAGKTEERGWALLPRGSFRLVFVPGDTTDARRYDRVISMEGNEELIVLRRSGDMLYFDPPPRRTPRMIPDTLAADSLTTPPGIVRDSTFQNIPVASPPLPDSTWALQWTGFEPVSDWPAWRSVAMGNPAEFRLLEAAGLAADSNGDWQVIGEPAATAPFQGGIVVGNSPWVPYLAQSLDSLVAGDTRLLPAQWAMDYRSAWAEALAPAMLASIDSIPSRSPAAEEALTYLRNWDYSYDQASIAAPIFDTWVALYQDSTGSPPQLQVPDTVYFENLLRYQLLTTAVGTLRRQFGPNLSQWRWEAVYPDTRYFPAWSADTLTAGGPGLFRGNRFEPIVLPGSGHPSALAWGSSPIQDERPHPAVWEGWTSTASWGDFQVRRRIVDLAPFLSRYRISERPPSPVTLSPAAVPVRTTTLTPAP